MDMIEEENEDNAILCIKVVMDLQRHHQRALADWVQPFLNFTQRLFENVDVVVRETFATSSQPGAQSTLASGSVNGQISQSPRAGSPAVPSTDSGPEHQQARPLLKGMQSFKVLAECPIAVVSIFQVYRDVVPSNVKLFVPLIKGVLLTQAPAQEKAHRDASAQGQIHYGMAKDIKNRAAFAELVTAQVKTMSFLAYILRVYGQQLSDFLPRLPEIVVRLLRDCPKEQCSVRRELLVAIRHIVNFNFRNVFLRVIDELLDERTLLGDSLTVHEALKPLAYSTVADLVHHVRAHLSLEQIRKSVKVFRVNLLAAISGTSFQSMSTKLLMNMAECIAKLEDKQEARYHLIAILDVTGDKFAAMNLQYANAVKVSAQYHQHSSEPTSSDFVAQRDQPPEWDQTDIFTASPIKTSNPRERGTDPVYDNKFLFRNLVTGLKGVFYQLRACNPPALVDPSLAPLNWNDVACGFSPEEVQVLIKLFHEGTKMFQYYESEKPPRESHLSPVEILASHHPSSSREEKELLESFATVFHHVDPAAFHEVFHSEIPHIYEMMFDHPALVQVPQFLLASEATSPSFAGMFLQFLMSRIEDVGSADVDKATILLRLFKLSFMAVTLFSQHNEQVLLPHVNKLITKSLKLSTTAEVPMHYFYLLRSLFRSIGGGRFEHLYHEILPLLEMLLEVLNDLIAATHNTQEQDLYVELSLTVPARLSNLLPHLSYLMKPLVLALRAGSELVSQGLRTLELCVDNLTADYLDPIMAPVIDELMTALWEHLRPGPYSHFHSHTTMRILGKLGGRNRKFLEGPPALQYEPSSEEPCFFEMRLVGAPSHCRFPAGLGLQTAFKKLEEPLPKAIAARTAQMLHKKQAFELITTQIKLMIGSDSLPAEFVQQVRSSAQALAEGNFDQMSKLQLPSAREQSISKRDEQQKTLRALLSSCLYATSIPDLASEAHGLMANIYRHFTILEIGRAIIEARQDPNSFTVDGGEGLMTLDHRVLIGAIVESLSSEKSDVREAAEEAILKIRDAATTIFGSRDKVLKLPLFAQFLSTFCHSCYEEDWYSKSGGALGINVLVTKLDVGSEWLIPKQLDISRALMYAAKDLPDDLPQATRMQAISTFNIVLRQCNQGISREEALKPSGPIHGLCSFLVLELCHTSRHMRKAAQDAFNILGEICGVEVHELIGPVKDRFFGHVFGKPLRALPFPLQVGYIDAMSYFLRLQNGLLESNEPMSRFLRESSFLAEQDNEAIPGRLPDQRHHESVTKLKVSCLRLLSLAIDFPDFGSSPTNKSRPRIIAVFFKSLYSKHAEVVDAANDALQAVVDRDSKLPKDILQAGLRPILVNLQDSSKLKIDNLHCLARLLHILKNYFKVEIGSRLLDNIDKIASAEILQKASFMLVEQDENVNIVTAILDIFHLLPPAAEQFMQPLIDKVLELENSIRRTHFSPFREPLVKFLNKYPQETWDKAFSGRIANDREYSRFFAQILADEQSGPIRETVAKKFQPVLSALETEGSDAERSLATINAIHVASSICLYPDSRRLLVGDSNLRRILMERGKSLELLLQNNAIDTKLRLAAEQSGERLQMILTTYLSENPDDLECLVDLVAAVTSGQLKETPHLQRFIYENIIRAGNLDRNRRVITQALDVFTSRNHSENMKAYVSRNLIIPILAMDTMSNWEAFGKGTDLVNTALIELFQAKVWKPQSILESPEDHATTNMDQSRMEMLQMTAMLLKYYSHVVQEARKDVIKFGWTYIRLDDTINKHAAYVVLAYFVAFFETPVKISSQIYGQLIAAHTSEARSLVTQALEILAPVIPKRMGGSESKIPVWAILARKPLVDDPSNLQQLLAVFQFVGRHPDLFYEAKEPLSQTVISSIPKVAQLPTMSMDSKRTALMLLTLLWRWEEQHIKDLDSTPASPASTKRKSNGDEVQVARTTTSFIQSTSLRFSLIKYLFQFLAFLPDRYPLPSAAAKELTQAYAVHAEQAADVCRRALKLFSDFLSNPYWDDLDISPMFPKVTEAILVNEPKAEEKAEVVVTRTVNTLQLLSAIVNLKPDEWVQARLGQLQKLLDKPIRHSHGDVQECLFVEDEQDQLGRKPMITRILQAIPVDTSEDGNAESEAPKPEFVSFLTTVAAEALSGSNINAGINILKAFASCRPREIDQHITILMKVLNHHIKEYLSLTALHLTHASMAPNTRPSESALTHAQELAQIDTHEQLIMKMVDVLAVRIVQLGDNRRPFLTTLTTLIEKSPKAALCSKIVNLVSEWVLDVNQVFPTVKEKNAVVLKMMSFEHRYEPALFAKFLDIVIRIYEDPKITRTELAVRLEPAFLLGTRAPNVEMRNRFMNLFDKHLSRSADRRVLYLLCVQNWEPLSDTFWLSQAIQLLFGSIEGDAVTHLSSDDYRVSAASSSFALGSQDRRGEDTIMLDGDFEALMADHARFVAGLGDIRVSNVLQPLCHLQHGSAELAKDIWASLFPSFWAILARDQQNDMKKDMITLLTRDWHGRQIDKRPNCIQALLEGIARANSPRMAIPHHLIKFLARTYDGWYIATTFMEDSAVDPVVDTPAVRESNLDALATLYADLQEEDLFYGLWRRRSQFLHTNTALSYEQIGKWEKAQRTFETATFKARTGETPFSQGEYMLWEDHWVICAQKLQQWEILADFAKVDSLNDLFLDSVWRSFDKWQTIEQIKDMGNIVKSVTDSPTPRRMFFQAFISLLKMNKGQETTQAFSRICDDSTQLSIRKWHQLPKRITNAHIPILQSFQQLVELHDASVICSSLSTTTQTNVDHKAPELKLLLGTWRDRLPNFWDDINAWQDLVTWRRHIFQLVNEKYLSLIPPQQSQQQSNAPGNSFAYRGYHETAWTINKFAHVARKHQLPEVCINQLSTVYTLPNIEIQEAFLKLREQAKCHYQNPSELQIGLDVINNTNLSFFNAAQKAEFYTLKGMFLTRQNQMEEANESFGSALFFDLKLPKAWAEWARYNERLFKEDPTSTDKAAAAVSCYLEAAGTYKNANSRKALGRVLWLLSLDDAEGKIARTFEDYKGDTPVWYWITFIPQLLVSMSKPEAKIVRSILLKLAKQYPQALYFHLRTSREDYQSIRKQHELKLRNARSSQASPPQVKQGSPDSRPNTADSRPGSSNRPGTAGSDRTAADGITQNIAAADGSHQSPQQSNDQPMQDSQDQAGAQANPQLSHRPQGPKQPWEYLEEVSSVLKTAFPLLALSVETMVDQISRNLKSAPDEEAYRLINALFNDALGYVSRAPRNYQQGSKLPQSTEANITRFAESILPPHIRATFEADFVTKLPDLPDYIAKLRKWRDRFEEKLDRRVSHNNLEGLGSHHLSEFKFHKFDEIEVPGQYLLHKDKNQDFVRIERFLPDVDLVRSSGVCYRKLKVRGHDGSLHSFMIQHPTPRTCRREERMMQMFRFFNDVLARRKESRRRKIQFTLPLMVPLTPAIRMVQDDSSYVTLQGIYEGYCRKKRLTREEPVLFAVKKLKELSPVSQEHAQQIRLQVYEAIQSRLVPNSIVLDYFRATYQSFSDFWLFRRQSSYQLAALTFMTYVMFMRDRTPARMAFSRASGNIWGSELVPSMAPTAARFQNNESVQVRLTPNLQMLLGPIAQEGIFSATVLIIAKALAEPFNPDAIVANIGSSNRASDPNRMSIDGGPPAPQPGSGNNNTAPLESKLEQMLSIFIRDEVNYWHTQNHRNNPAPADLRRMVDANGDLIVKRAISLAKSPQEGMLPANQTVVDLVCKAVDPRKLSQMDSLWMPYL